jgi:hypothetical protein
MAGSGPHQSSKSGFLGSLKEALAAASRDDTQTRGNTVTAVVPAQPSASAAASDPDATQLIRREPAGERTGLSAAEAAREARTPPPAPKQSEPPQVEFEAPPTTRVVRAPKEEKVEEPAAKTQLVRGKQAVKRGEFEHDPVVGWLVVVGGPGLGSFRPVYEGNNTVGRSPTQRIPLDFGDDSISSEEQAYIRYDSSERSFLFVPNLAKTNIVSVNSKRPTGAVELSQMDVIVMGRTQLVFVPFCGPEFDWAELGNT